LAAILDTFVGENHLNFGKPVLQEVRKKISATLTATLADKVFSQEEIQNRRDAVPKKPVYCFNSETKVLEATFSGQRPMARELDINISSVIFKINTKDIFSHRRWRLVATLLPEFVSIKVLVDLEY